MTITYTGNETSKISKMFKKADKNIHISFKTSNKLNNILNNKSENFNIYGSKGIYKLTCDKCEKFFIGRTNRNFKTTFKEPPPQKKRSYLLRRTFQFLHSLINRRGSWNEKYWQSTSYQQDDRLKKDLCFNKRRASLKMCS